MGGNEQMPCLKAAFSVRHPSLGKEKGLKASQVTSGHRHCYVANEQNPRFPGNGESQVERRNGPLACGPLGTTWQTDRALSGGSPPLAFGRPTCIQTDVVARISRVDLAEPDSVGVHFLCSPPLGILVAFVFILNASLLS